MRHAIITSVFKPGERLQVDEIAQKLGVSLTPVRQALQQLSTEGLIEIHARSGTYVTTVSPQDIEETFDIRCALECLAGERALRRIQPAQIARLRDLLETLATPVDDDAKLK
jgi:DNA-binding GntR family transcriptional regulator